MAVDRWLLHQHQQGQSPPVLRFYTWSPAAVSLGYHQRRWPPAWRSLVWRGQPVDLVRRPSGGRAVLHAGDLTYALIASGFKGERLQVYRQVCQFLVEGLGAVDVPLVLGSAGRGYIHNPNCFGTATGADLVGAADPAQKIIGSAQFWSASCLLQHGSIRLSVESGLYREVFGEVENRIHLPQALAELPEEMRLQRLIAELKSAAERCFDACFYTAALTSAEIAAAVEAFSLPV
ncbi:MAG: lipoate--protein ligase family protein [Cyanobacteria bacterium Co-bin13]|nr:lipoate--protein ligase family protein [Cyanobacteria bacterium Co-bin13]